MRFSRDCRPATWWRSMANMKRGQPWGSICAARSVFSMAVLPISGMARSSAMRQTFLMTMHRFSGSGVGRNGSFCGPNGPGSRAAWNGLRDRAERGQGNSQQSAVAGQNLGSLRRATPVGKSLGCESIRSEFSETAGPSASLLILTKNKTNRINIDFGVHFTLNLPQASRLLGMTKVEGRDFY